MAWNKSDFHDLIEAIAQPMLRRVLLGVFMLLTVALVYSATQLRVDAGFSKMVPLEHEYMRTFTEYQKTFGGANRVLVALRVKGAGGDIYTLLDDLASDSTIASVGANLFFPAVLGVLVVMGALFAFNAVNPIGYAIRDSVTSGGYGDYRHVDDRIQFALAIHGASIGYRQFSERMWGMSVERNRIQLSFRF